MRIVVILALAALVIGIPAAAQTAAPPAPTNLEVVHAGPDSIAVVWGPSQPGEFYGVSEDKTSLVIAWGISQDARSPVTYTLTRNGTTVASGLMTNTYRLTGLPRKVRSLRTCVTAVNAAGQQSPPMCATWNR